MAKKRDIQAWRRTPKAFGQRPEEHWKRTSVLCLGERAEQKVQVMSSGSLASLDIALKSRLSLRDGH